MTNQIKRSKPEYHPGIGNLADSKFPLEPLMGSEVATSSNEADEIKKILQQFSFPHLSDFVSRLLMVTGKKSFLVFKNNKYINILTENIAMFYIKYESPMIMCFDKQEYFVNYSLEQIQSLLPRKQFFRLNRQYLVNFNAIKEAEHYFARKLLINPIIPVNDKLLVSKEKVTEFLHWLDNR